ncbi:hypothetical protein HDU76_011014, partial [Blyttiomyces sp. JEL0837]
VPGMEGRLPTEVIDAIFDHGDPLTQFINNRLSDDEVKSKATDIWNAAFEQDWAGDLNLLPQHGFPSILNGLSKVTSRSMHDRPCSIRPDLVDNNHALKVFLYNNPNYGKLAVAPSTELNPYDIRPIILADYTIDHWDPKGDKTTNLDTEEAKIAIIQNKLSYQLIQIPLRQCWMEDFQHLISIDPKNFVIMAIILGHLELVKRLVDEIKVVESDDFTEQEIVFCLHSLIASEFDDMLFFCCERFSSILRNMLPHIRGGLFLAALRSGKVQILDYF